MFGLVLHGIGDLSYEKVPLPVPGTGQVLLRVGFCGVCGSDIPRIFKKGTYRFPTICGHEFSGTIESLGNNVSDWKVGDRASVFPLLWCGECAACERGQYVQCFNYDYLGSRRDGGFADFVVVPTKNLIRLPDSITLQEAAMLEPSAVALHAIRRGGGCSAGDNVAIYGAGPIGLMVALWAKSLGASSVIVFDVLTEKLSLARHIGLIDVFDSRVLDPISVISEFTNKNGVDLAIDAAGVPQTIQQAIGSAGRGGRVVFLGNPSGDAVLSSDLLSHILRKELSIFGTWNSEYSAAGNRDDWRDTLDAIEQGILNLKPLITHEVALDTGARTLELMRQGSFFYSKVLMHPLSNGVNQ